MKLLKVKWLRSDQRKCASLADTPLNLQGISGGGGSPILISAPGLVDRVSTVATGSDFSGPCFLGGSQVGTRWQVWCGRTACEGGIKSLRAHPWLWVVVLAS